MVNEFSSIFEIFVALHLGGWFFDAIKTEYSQIPEKLYKLYGKVVAKNTSDLNDYNEKFGFLVDRNDNTHPTEFDLQIKKITQKFFDRNEEILTKEKLNFIPTFSSIYIITLFFSFSILLIGAFEQFYSTESINVLLAFINLEAFVIVFYFFRSFSQKRGSKFIGFGLTFLLFLLPIVFYFLSSMEFEYTELIPVFSLKTNISISMVISVSMAPLLLLRIGIQNVWTKYKLRKNLNNVMRSLKNLGNMINLVTGE